MIVTTPTVLSLITGQEKGAFPAFSSSFASSQAATARTTMEVKEVLCMNGGDGETSYAKNSYFQREIMGAVRSVVEEAVLGLYCAAFPDKLSVADLGCASGPNALSVVTHVVDTIEERCRQLGRPLPEFQLFLNDLPGNDFNSVFRSLQSLYELREASGRGRELRRCFVAGVPGSFHGRLFQSRSVHFFHSATSLHWLSQDPLKLQQHDVPLNKRNIYISKESPPFIVNAYSMQFEKDFSNFLKSRSEEMVVGGRIVLVLLGRKTSDPTSEEVVSDWAPLTQVLMDMAQEGYIAEEKVDSFNLPFYKPCAMEVEREIRREGSFSLKSLQIFDVDWAAAQEHGNHIKHSGVLSEKLAKSAANSARAVIESMLASHFGGDIIEELFSRYTKVHEDYFSRRETKLTNLVVSLVRKS